VIESKDLADSQRTLLLEIGFIRSVMKGWYISSNPSDHYGDSTAWYANYWAFMSGYLAKRFSKSNGITEGFHTKMEMISRRAFGFRNFQNYRLRVLALCGWNGVINRI
jgi:hypothetical protein